MTNIITTVSNKTSGPVKAKKPASMTAIARLSQNRATWPGCSPFRQRLRCRRTRLATAGHSQTPRLRGGH
jgi:hypothetical protein